MGSVYVEPHWSHRLQRRLWKVGVTGTSRTLLLSDDELAQLSEQALGALPDDRTDD